MTPGANLNDWQRAWETAQPRLSALRDTFLSSKSPNSRVLRVGQLDAELLDQELVTILKEPLEKALSLVNSTLKTRYAPELALIIKIVLYKFSVWDWGASYGARLQGLTYRLPRRLPRTGVLALHALLTILVPYAHNRLRGHALSYAWPDAPSTDRRRKLWDLLGRLEFVHTFSALVNFLAFLRYGRYRSLSDRLLRLRLVPALRLNKRTVSYEFMNRQMVWHAFTEFLLFVLPLIDIRSLRRRIAQLYTTFNPNSLGALLPVPMQKLLSGRGDISTNSSVQVDMGPYHTLPIDQCAICAQAASFDVALLSSNAPIKSSSSDTKPALENDPEAAPPLYPLNTPYTASCGHAYCYICLSTAILRAADDDGIPWACLRCVKPIQWIERVEAPAQSIGSSSEFEWSGSEMEAGSSSVGSLDFTNSDIGSDQ